MTKASVAPAVMESRVVAVEVEPERVVLELSRDEADVIYDTFYRKVTGSVSASRRVLTTSITNALRGAGIDGKGGEDLSGNINMLTVRD